MKLLITAIVCFSLTGCFPLLLGVKHVHSGNTDIDFITGADATVSANGIDHVDNQRGINPK